MDSTKKEVREAQRELQLESVGGERGRAPCGGLP